MTSSLPVLLRNVHIMNVDAVLEPPLLVTDGDIIPTHLPLAHQPVGRKRPVLKPVRAPPLAPLVVPLVPELHRDAISLKGKQLLAQPVAVLARPLVRKEGLDGVAPLQEGGAVAPDGVGRVCH